MALEASNKMLLTQLAPFTDSLRAGVQTNSAAVAAATGAAEEEAAQAQAAAATRAAAAAARDEADRLERLRVRAALPSQRPPVNNERRLRGDLERLPSREAVVERLQQNTGDISKRELEELISVLLRGAQVDTHAARAHAPLSAWGLEVAGRQDRAAPSLFESLQDNGLAPPAQGEAALRAITTAFKSLADKETKKATAVASFADFCEFMRKARLTSRATFERDPEAFWQMQWHCQSVTFIKGEHGWPTARVYHDRVMKAWQEGFLDLSSMVETEECRRGDIEGALHLRSYMLAVQQTGSKARSTSSGSSASAQRKTGTKERSAPSDTYCSHCVLYFRVESNHKTSTCRKKKKADAGSKDE